MSEDTGRGPDVEHATSVGQTGGLPGENAHWRTSRVPEDELASTVQRGDVAAWTQDGADGSGAGGSGAGGSGAGGSGAGASGAAPEGERDGDVRRAVESDVANGDLPDPSDPDPSDEELSVQEEFDRARAADASSG